MRRYQAERVAGESGFEAGAAPSVVVLRDVTEARAASAARDAFLGVLSHELRTPITTIYGGSELLQRGLDEERRNEVMSDIRVESERLARLVEDLLVMTRVERGTSRSARSRSSPAPAASPWCTASCGAVAGRAGHAQPRRAALGRARRHRRTSSRSCATCSRTQCATAAARRAASSSLAEEVDGEVVVRVLDRGDGFGDVNPERLFELFYRTDAARSVPGGAGSACSCPPPDRGDGRTDLGARPTRAAVPSSASPCRCWRATAGQPY